MKFLGILYNIKYKKASNNGISMNHDHTPNDIEIALSSTNIG
jgi:hypothetical protein